MRRALAAMGVIAFAASTAACSGNGDDSVPSVPAESATSAAADRPFFDFTGVYRVCGLEGLRGVDLSADGNSLSVTQARQHVPGVNTGGTEAACVAVELDMPDSVLNRLSLAEPGDPAESAEWGEIALTWRYTSDGDLAFIYERAS